MTEEFEYQDLMLFSYKGLMYVFELESYSEEHVMAIAGTVYEHIGGEPENPKNWEQCSSTAFLREGSMRVRDVIRHEDVKVLYSKLKTV